MKALTNKEFTDRGLETKVAPCTFSFLSPAELKELRRAVRRAYPTYTAAQKKRTVVSLACAPTSVAGFIDRVNAELGA